MIHKWYEVTCDYCGAGINHYIGSRPTREMLEADGAVCTATKHFCSETCWGEWNHDRQQRQYLNLHPDIKTKDYASAYEMIIKLNELKLL